MDELPSRHSTVLAMTFDNAVHFACLVYRCDLFLNIRRELKRSPYVGRRRWLLGNGLVRNLLFAVFLRRLMIGERQTDSS